MPKYQNSSWNWWEDAFWQQYHVCWIFSKIYIFKVCSIVCRFSKLWAFCEVFLLHCDKIIACVTVIVTIPFMIIREVESFTRQKVVPMFVCRKRCYPNIIPPTKAIFYFLTIEWYEEGICSIYIISLCYILGFAHLWRSIWLPHQGVDLSSLNTTLWLWTEINSDWNQEFDTHMIKIYFLCAHLMESVKHCNWSALSLSNNVPLGWFRREIGRPRDRNEGPTRASRGEAPRTETLGPRWEVVAPLVDCWPPTATPPDCRVLLLPLLACSHVGEDTEDGVADLVRLLA